MIERSPAVDDLVRRLLQHESSGAPDAASRAAAVDRVCRKLAGELETLVGQGGAAALLRRAVSLAKREFPFLPELRPRPDEPVSFDAVRTSLQERRPAEAEAASTALLANLLGLLVNLLGEDLGLRPVVTVWPNLPPGAAPPASREPGE